MIKFKSITITNFKSIEYAELFYHKGIWEVVGNNTDSTLKSNGAGKSTVLEAIQQCLYNKNLKGITIEDTYNRKTKKGYRLILKFSVGSDRYRIDNNREASTYDVYQNDICISKKTIPDNLKLVQSIIGFDFNSFCALTYVSHQNVVTLLDSFTSSNLMKVLLDFDSISIFEARTKEAFSTSKSRAQYLVQENTQLQDTITLVSEFKYTDLTPSYRRKQEINHKFAKDTCSIDIEKVQRRIQSINKELEELNKSIETVQHQHSGNPCPTCGQAQLQLGLISKELYKFELNKLEDNKKELLAELEQCTKDHSDKADVLTKLRHTFDEQTRMVDAQITIGEYKNKLYEDNKELINITTSKLEDNKKELSQEYFKQDLYDIILKTIKAGKLHKDLLDNFVKVLNIYIDEYTKFMSISYLNIKSKASKTGIEFHMYDSRYNQFIDINTLSGGELTRIRIIVLMSMLKTISSITSLSTNILVLDEALDTLDKSAANDLSMLFSYLIQNENKFIALVSHGEQLNEIEFTGKIQAIKSNGSTVIEQRGTTNV